MIVIRAFCHQAAMDAGIERRNCVVHLVHNFNNHKEKEMVDKILEVNSFTIGCNKLCLFATGSDNIKNTGI